MRNKAFLFKKLVPIVLVVLSLSIWFAQKGLRMSAVDKYKPYTFVKKNLSNGMEVLLVKDPELPYISFDMMLKTGSKLDPKGKEGLTSLLAEIIDKGSKKRTAIQMIQDIELLGTSFYYDLEKDSLSFSIETLSWLDKEALKIFSEIITEPTFLEEEFERARKKAIGRVKTSPENFSYYASRAFNRYIYGEHPYSSYTNGSLNSLKNIQVTDVREFYSKYFTPKQIVLSVSGRYPEDIIEKLEVAFGNWKNKTEETSDTDISLSSIKNSNKQEVLIVNQKAAVQSEIRMGHLSVPRSHPDYLALRAANVVVGGSFHSRLQHRIRVQKGLTYGISSYFSSKKELGIFQLGLAVRNSKLGTALIEILAVLEDVHKNGLTQEELDRARQLLKNQFITGVATGDNFAQLLLYFNSQNIPYSYAEEYFKKLSALTLSEVNRALMHHLHPDKMKIVVLTNAEEVKSQLKDFEPITVQEYTEFL